MLEPKYHINCNGNESGPFTASELRALAKKGQITTESLIRKGNGTWVPATSIKNLFKNEAEPPKPKTNLKVSKIAPPPLPNQSPPTKPILNPPSNSLITVEDQDGLEEEEKESNGKPLKLVTLQPIAVIFDGKGGSCPDRT